MAFVGIWLRALVVGTPFIFAAYYLMPYFDTARAIGRPADSMALGGWALILGLVGASAFIGALVRSFKLAGDRHKAAIIATPVTAEGDFDADAVFARAMARRAAEQGIAPDAPSTTAAPAPRGFGRKPV